MATVKNVSMTYRTLKMLLLFSKLQLCEMLHIENCVIYHEDMRLVKRHTRASRKLKKQQSRNRVAIIWTSQ